jgi:hypothetical protein
VCVAHTLMARGGAVVGRNISDDYGLVEREIYIR